jgi:hypothetical protein
LDVTHFLVENGDDVTVIDPTSPWARRVSDSSYGLSPYTFDRLSALQASGKVTFIGERVQTITPTTLTTDTQTIALDHPPIDATGEFPLCSLLFYVLGWRFRSALESR